MAILIGQLVEDLAGTVGIEVARELVDLGEQLVARERARSACPRMACTWRRFWAMRGNR